MNHRRATDLESMQDKLSRLFTEEGVKSGLEFKPQATDVIISPYAKCGTTWMQQTVHGLRTRGDMNFGEITEVVPWIEAAADLGQDLQAAQVATPRAFKSHLPWDLVPKGCRYICVLRDPLRALVSLYRFFSGWVLEPGSVSLDDFARQHFLPRPQERGYWHHLASWMEQRDNPDVLLLCYEQLQTDFDTQLPRIADFLGIELDPELAALVHRQSSLSFMTEHGQHFDDHFLRLQRYSQMQVPAQSSSSKVMAAGGAPRPQAGPDVVEAMARRWREEVTPRIGFPDYAALCNWFEASSD